MENDVLKNKIAPWQEKGQWYHLRIMRESEESMITIDYLHSDLIFQYSDLLFSSELNDWTITNIDQVIDMIAIFTLTSPPQNDSPVYAYNGGYNFKHRKFDVGFELFGMAGGYIDLYLYIV